MEEGLERDSEDVKIWASLIRLNASQFLKLKLAWSGESILIFPEWEANPWQHFVRFFRVHHQFSLLWVGERHRKVLCQRTHSSDPVRVEPEPLYMESSALTTGHGMEWVDVPIRSWKKEKVKRERKKKEKFLCLAMLAWTLIIYLSKEFLKHSIASFLLFKQRWHIPCRSLPKHKSST